MVQVAGFAETQEEDREAGGLEGKRTSHSTRMCAHSEWDQSSWLKLREQKKRKKRGGESDPHRAVNVSRHRWTTVRGTEEEEQEAVGQAPAGHLRVQAPILVLRRYGRGKTANSCAGWESRTFFGMESQSCLLETRAKMNWKKRVGHLAQDQNVCVSRMGSIMLARDTRQDKAEEKAGSECST